jgi:hypothetical protein
MNTFSGALWLRLFTAVLGQKALVAARPRLAPFVFDFEQVIALLTRVLSVRDGQDAELDALRLAARTWDAEHDDAHRSFVWLLQAFGVRGTTDRRATVQAVLRSLYPSGLDVVTRSYAEEVGAAQAFGERTKAIDVQQGLAVIGAELPGVASWIDRIVGAGAELGKALDAIDLRLSVLAGAAKGEGHRYIDALNASRRTWSHFLSTVNYDLKEEVPEEAALRELLVGPYHRELDRLASRSSATPQPTEQPEG